MTQTIEVELLQRLSLPLSEGGALYHPGERVSFAPVIAADLITRGVARPAPVREDKGYDGPAADKMIHDGAVKKKPKRW